MAEMFTEVARPTTRVGAKRWYTIPLSIVIHASLFSVLIAIPLLATGTLPLTPSVLVFAAPAPPTLPEVPHAASPKPPTAAASDTPSPGPPTEAPSTIEPERPSFSMAVPGVAGLPPGLVGVDALPPMTGVPVAPVVVAAEPVRPGGQIKVPVKIQDASPVYPPFAVKAKVSGIVIIEATIDTKGRVIDAKVLRSIPLLDQAALDAVRQWRYRPTLLNGVPISIVMTVTVNFTLR